MNIRRLKDLREDHDLLQKDIAKIINVSQQQYNKYELGINSIPIEKLDKLATFYNTSIDYIIGKTNIKKAYQLNEINHKQKISYQIN